MSEKEESKEESKENSLDKARRKRLTGRLKALRERSRMLELELENYTNDHFRVCIFGSARIKPEDKDYKTTYDLAKSLGKHGIDVLTGGGPGLMEAANKGLIDGTKEFGTNSKSYGITIELNKFEEKPSQHLDIKHHHRRFSSRLDDFMRLSHAIVVVHGGVGTVLELFFSWQLIQVGHMEERPIILVGKEFWSGLIQWVKDFQVKQGLVSEHELRWVHLVDTPEEAVELIKKEQAVFLEGLEEIKEVESNVEKD